MSETPTDLSNFPRLRDFQDQKRIRDTGIQWLALLVGLVLMPVLIALNYSEVDFIREAPFAFGAALLLLAAAIMVVVLSAQNLSQMQRQNLQAYVVRLDEESTERLLFAFQKSHLFSDSEITAIAGLLDRRMPGWRG